MRRVLVTGATGFIGRHVADALRPDGALEVFRTARALRPGVDGAADLKARHEADALIAETRPDAIVHAAGVRHGTAAELVASNIAAARNLLWAASCAEAPPQVVLIGSAAEYGPQPAGILIDETVECRPASAYGRSKLAATGLAGWFRRNRGLNVTVLRFFNVIGPGMGGLPGEAACQLDGGPRLDWAKEAHSLPMVRDFVRVADVAEACRRVLHTNRAPAIINVCTGAGRSFAALLDEMEAVAGRPLGHPRPAIDGDSVIGDATLCERVLGFRPSAEIGDMLAAAVRAGRDAA